MSFPDRQTNFVPDDKQATSKIVVDLYEAVAPRAILDSLRSIAGSAGGETTLSAAVRRGATSVAMVDVTNIATGTELYLWNTTNYDWERVEVASVAAGIAPAGTATLRHALGNSYVSGSVVSATPPFDDIYEACFRLTDTVGPQGTRQYLVFSNANPAALVEGGITGATFVHTHFDSFAYDVALGAGGITDCRGPVPICAMPCRYITMLTGAAAWIGMDSAGPNHFGSLTLSRRRGLHASMPVYHQL